MQRAAVIASAAALGACSLVVDLSDLGSPSDASSDLATFDAFSLDVGTGHFCSQGDDAHLLCEDFDEVDGGWTSQLQPVTNGVSLTVGTGDSVSAPASLQVTAASDNAVGYLLATLPQPMPMSFRCALSVRVSGITTGKLVQTGNLVFFTTDPNVTKYSVHFQGDSLIGTLYEFQQATDGGIVETPKALPYSIIDGNWHKLALGVHLTPPATADVTLDDGITTTRSITPPGTITGATFTIGVLYTNSPTGWSAHFDDAFCDAL